MFVTRAHDVLINEIAPRVHNSGHYTMDACVTSQFEQHIRAITGLPLGSTAMHGPAAAMINILGERDGPTNVRGLDKVLSHPRTKVHLYGKSPTKVDRKMGHINVTAESVTAAAEAARAARRGLEL
jgi:5-(carboxyamino)imidazole ribonucleotide synthase